MQARYFCNAMPWVDCTALRYHCTKLPDVDLCPEAYAEGRFPPGCTARDFIKLDGARAPPVSPLPPALCKRCGTAAAGFLLLVPGSCLPRWGCKTAAGRSRTQGC